MQQKECIIIAGPTASGKTDLAIQVASQFQTQILSADSRQCYRELNIGVARPDPVQLETVPHHFIASHSITETLTAADFENIADHFVHEIFKSSQKAVLVGGTGLYIKAFVDGLDDIPETDPEIRSEIRTHFEQFGMEWLENIMIKEDPLYAERGAMENPQRMMRALEVVRTTGKSILHFQKNHKKTHPFRLTQICLDIPRSVLYERINQRVDKMMEAGLLEEVKSLINFKQLNALQTVGYRELFDYFEGQESLEKAVERIKQNTRHYAKRQLTWFKKDPGFIWLKPEEVMTYLLSKRS
jgi:tRNA dimethylallyltransferase